MSHRKKKWVAALASLLLASSALPAFGAVGGDVVPGPGGQLTTNLNKLLYLNDDYIWNDRTDPPVQGWGMDSYNYAMNQITSYLGKDFLTSDTWGEPAIRQACTGALNNAIARGKQEHGSSVNRARVIGIQLWYDNSPGFDSQNRVSLISRNKIDAAREFGEQWPKQVSDLRNYDSTQKNAVKAELERQISSVDQRVLVVCVAKNEMEPPETVPTYDLTIETTASKGQAAVGNAHPVSDMVTGSNNSGATGNVNGQVILTWDGYPASSAVKTATKNLSIPVNGSVRSPQFTPGDFGWSVWPAGRYWFDVKVPKQGDMNAAVDTNDRIAAETFTIDGRPPVKPLATGDGSAEASGNTTLRWRKGSYPSLVGARKGECFYWACRAAGEVKLDEVAAGPGRPGSCFEAVRGTLSHDDFSLK